MSEVRTQILDRLASFRISDGTLEVALIRFTTIETGDTWVYRVVDYIPDGARHPTNRMFLPPPKGWETTVSTNNLVDRFGQKIRK